MFLSLLCALWIGLLRHRWFLAASIQGVRSPLRFLKAATGGGALTWRQWLLPLGLSDLPTGYHVLWALAVVMLAGTVDRWYLGLRWFELVPYAPGLLALVAIAIGLLTYLIWLWFLTGRCVRRMDSRCSVESLWQG